MPDRPPLAHPEQEIEQLIYRIDHLFGLLILGPNNHTDLVSEIGLLVEALIQQTHTNPDAMLGIVHLRTDFKYSVIRAIQNTLFALLVSERMEWFDPSRTHSLCCAALTEQISLYPIRDTLSEQAGGITPWQMQIIEQYPQKAVRLLLSIGVTDPRWIHAVGAQGEIAPPATEVSTEITILSIVNRYGALISSRGERPPSPREEIEENLLQHYPTELEQKIISILLERVGPYPPGTAVELTNGEIAIVTRHTPKHAHPQVSTICDAEGVQLKRPQPRDSNDPQYGILRAIQPDWMQHLNAALLWGEEESTPDATLFEFHRQPPPPLS